MSGYNKDLYEFYKRNKICVSCGQEKAVKNRVRCFDCLEKNRDCSRKRLEKETEEEKRARLAYDNAYKKIRYKEMKNNGLCVNCGKPQSRKSTVLCLDCAIKNQRRNEKKKSGIERYERKLYGKCYVCNEPVGKCGTMCDKCYEMVCANLPKKMTTAVYMMHKQQNKAIFRS